MLGISVPAAAIYTGIAALAEFFYHWNVRTPRWLGPFFQRPESHRVHHKQGYHTNKFSGLVKLASPSWVDGTAFWHVAQNPLARDGFLRDVVLGLPAWGFQLLTWKALALEILFLPLALWHWTRPVIWLALVLMHVGILALVSFADLSAGMLMLHLFTVDSRWPGMAREVRDRLTREGMATAARPAS